MGCQYNDIDDKMYVCVDMYLYFYTCLKEIRNKTEFDQCHVMMYM